MRYVVISGSRDPKGQTGRSIAALTQGLESAGATGCVHYLPTLDIQHCNQCNAQGWGLCQRAYRCGMYRDLDDLVVELQEADLAIFATPVYFGSLSESLRAFTDRLRRIAWLGGQPSLLQGKAAVTLCVAGGGGGGAANCIGDMAKPLQTCGYEIIDMWPIRRQNLEAKLPQLTAAGEWLGVL